MSAAIITDAPPGMRRHRPSRVESGTAEVVHIALPPPGDSSSAVPPPPGLPPACAVINFTQDKSGKTAYVPAYKRDRYKLSSPDEEEEESPYMVFHEKAVRHGFIRKVFAILAAQLLVTIGGVALMISSQSVIDYVQATPAIFYTAWVVTIVVLAVLTCCDGVRRQYPFNFVMLAVFTASETFLIGVVSTFFDTTALLILLGVVLAVSLGIMGFAMQSKFDFTTTGAMVLVCAVVGAVFAVSALTSPHMLGQLLFAAFGAIIFGAFMVYDTQMVVGGKHRKYKLTPDEYVFAALNLYLDIITLFMLALFVLIGKAEK